MNLEAFQNQLLARAKALQGRVAFPEDDDPRILQAAYKLLSEAVVSQVIFCSRSRVEQQCKVLNLDLKGFGDCVRYIEEDYPEAFSETLHLYQHFFERRGKPISREELQAQGESRLAQCGAALAKGLTDCVIAGVVANTSEVIRTALATIGLAPGIRTVSGSFIMVPPDPNKGLLLYADAGVVIAPKPPQLVDIAVESVAMWGRVCPEVPPRVAFLSFSTKGSADHALADKMRTAAEEFKARCPRVAADGELQFDAAIDPEIGARKSPGSEVAGQANIFIFPDLNAGNIAYKITQRLAGYGACGPLLQGLAKPFSDLSRGSTVPDIILTTCINLLPR